MSLRPKSSTASSSAPIKLSLSAFATTSHASIFLTSKLLDVQSLWKKKAISYAHRHSSICAIAFLTVLHVCSSFLCTVPSCNTTSRSPCSRERERRKTRKTESSKNEGERNGEKKGREEYERAIRIRRTVICKRQRRRNKNCHVFGVCYML